MPQGFSVQNIISAVIAVFVAIFLAWLFFWRSQKYLSRLQAQPGVSIVSLLLKSLRIPICIGIVLAGLYFAVLLLPLNTSFDYEIRRGLHTAFLILAGWVASVTLDAVYRWYKLVVAAKTKTALDDWIIGLLRILTPIAALFLVLVATLNLFGVSIRPLLDWLLTHGTRISLIILISLATIFILGKFLPPIIEKFVFRRAQGQPEEESKKRADTLSNVLATTGQVFIIAVAIFMVLAELGINITPILTGAGVLGLAIGFGAQTLVKDYLAGLFIIMENQYRVGDVVTISGISGLVEQIDLRRTILRDLDGIQHVVSNGEIRISSNFTKEVSRVNLNISVSYATDLDYASDVINRVCREMAEDPYWGPLIVKTPEVLRVDNLGDSGIDLKVLGETKPIRQWEVMGEMRKRIKKAFDKEGIEIPWPHTKIYFGNWPPMDKQNKNLQ